MMKRSILLFSMTGALGAGSARASTSVAADTDEASASATLEKKEVIENPTLQNLSGALRRWSFYSSFSYRGGSLKTPFSAERPNILSAEESVGLVDMSGNVGVKYRAGPKDNLSLQVGLYSTAPFHSSLETDNKKNAQDFEKNHQRVDVDDPTLSYFRTYYLGKFQNVSFVRFQWATRGVYRDYGLRYGMALSQATAYKVASFAYVALTLNYENFGYDKDTTLYRGFEVSLFPYQTAHTVRANVSGELYLSRAVSVRLITDLVSFYNMRGETGLKRRGLQQTLAMSYFFNRDISVAPNLRFVVSDLRAARTNVGLNLNVNL